MFIEMAARYRVALHTREVRRSSLSFILPNEGKRAILRARDEVFLSDFARLNLKGCRALHLDGHQADAALHYARECRAQGILTSLDGGGVRTNTQELLEHIDVAIVAERLCEQMELTPSQMLDFLKAKGEEDYFDQVRFWSNYQLEMRAKSKYGWRSNASAA